jgi:hypothetical protein
MGIKSPCYQSCMYLITLLTELFHLVPEVILIKHQKFGFGKLVFLAVMNEYVMRTLIRWSRCPHGKMLTTQWMYSLMQAPNHGESLVLLTVKNVCLCQRCGKERHDIVCNIRNKNVM